MDKRIAKIKYLDLYGLRKEKYEFLENHDIKNTKWQILGLKEPYYFFVPKDPTGEKKYNKFISLEVIFNQSSTGIKTHRDEVIVKDNDRELRAILSIFFDRMNDDEYVRKYFKFNDKDLSEFKKIREEYIKEKIKDELLVDYNYRIFDKKVIYFDNYFVTRLRDKFMKNLLKDNISIVTTRILSSEKFQHIFISDLVGDICYMSNKGKESNYYFPLYLYDGNKYDIYPKKRKIGYGTMMLFDAPKLAKQSNIKKEILSLLTSRYSKDVSPEQLFYYIYAILYSDKYRKKYSEFLKIDFPRIPFTVDYKLFSAMSKYGKELADLHLLKSKKLEKLVAKFPEIGDSKVEKREYKNNKIYINDKQYFSGVKPDVWDYYIGGYQVLDKWLKSRIGKNLSSEDVEHFLKVVSVLQNTIRLQKEIDKIYLDIEKKTV